MVGPYSINLSTYYIVGIGEQTDVIISGNLNYKPESVNYFPAYTVSYVIDKDTITGTFDYLNYKNLFPDSSEFRRIISKREDSVMQLPWSFPYIELNFMDPAIIPAGKWQVYRRTTKERFADILYDENGNYIDVVLYKNGKAFQHFKSMPCNKRKLPRLNMDGSYKTAECVDFKVEFRLR